MKGLVIFLALVLTVATAFAAELVLQPGSEGKDSQVNIRLPDNNFGSNAYLMQNYGPSYEARALIEFDLSSISGATINSAKLDLWIGLPNPTNYDFGVYRVTASWEEMTVTWNKQPTHYATSYNTIRISGAVGGPYTWDVKKLVQEWVSKTYPNYGLMVKRVDMNNPTNWPYFCSSDHTTTSYRPKLTVDYTPSAITPTSFGKVKAVFK